MFDTGYQHVVPVVPNRTQAADPGMGRDHGTGRPVAGRVVVEAAVDGAAPFEQAGKPGRVAAHSRSGDAGGAGKNDQATDGVDGGDIFFIVAWMIE